MRTIIVDDEFWAIEQLKRELQNVEDIDLEGCFSNAEEALAYAASHKVEFALLDVRMQGMDGLQLGYKLREMYPEIVIVYVSSYPEYFSEAYRNVRADYYMLKPYRDVDVRDVLERARLLSKRQRNRVQIRTFGKFDVFIDGQVLKFKNAKAKELLAICVDRKGGNVTLEEAIDKLWEGSALTENVKTRYRKAVSYLHSILTENGVGDIFVSGYGFCNIRCDNVECDYYEFIRTEKTSHFFGEYMQEYSWAENTNAWISMKVVENKYRAEL